MRTRTDATAYVGIVASVTATALVLAPSWHGSALVGALVLACIPAGAAVMCWVDCGERTAQAGLTLVVSLTLFTICSVTMIWLQVWHPWALLMLAGACLASCTARLLRGSGR